MGKSDAQSRSFRSVSCIWDADASSSSACDTTGDAGADAGVDVGADACVDDAACVDVAAADVDDRGADC